MPSSLLSARWVRQASALSPRAVVGQPLLIVGDARRLPTLPSGCAASPPLPPSPTHRLGAASPPTLAARLSLVRRSFFASHTSVGKPPNSISPQATHGGRESPLLGSLTIRHYGGEPLRLQAVGAARFSPWCRSASLRSRGILAACLPPFGLCVGRLASLLILAHPPVPPCLRASGLCPSALRLPPPSLPSVAARGAFPFCVSGAHCRPRPPASVFHV